MYGCMYVWLYGCMVVCMYGCMYVCMYVCMVVWLYVCMVVCMYVYVHVHLVPNELEHFVGQGRAGREEGEEEEPPPSRGEGGWGATRTRKHPNERTILVHLTYKHSIYMYCIWCIIYVTVPTRDWTPSERKGRTTVSLVSPSDRHREKREGRGGGRVVVNLELHGHGYISFTLYK